MNNDYKKIIEIFKQNDLDGFVNITQSDSKDLTYSPLYDEESLDSTNSKTTTVVIIKNNKKASFTFDGYSLDLINSSILDLKNVIDFSKDDKDIILPEIFDEAFKDFSELEFSELSYAYLKQEFLKLKNFNFKENISIESFSIGGKKSNHTYINSNGSVKTQIDTGSYFVVELLALGEESSEVEYKYFEFGGLPKINLDEITDLENILLDKIAKNTNVISPGKYDVTLDREVVIGFLEIVLGNLYAESIREGLSMFKADDFQTKIFSEKLTLINNPDLPGFSGNYLFDGEGVTAKKTTLIENGVLKTKFYDYKNALKEGLENLGNSSIANIELVGETTSEFLEGSKILFTNLMAFHTVDSTTGKFSLSGEGYLLENGKKAGYIKNISLSGDVKNLFSNIKYIGNDFKTDGNFKVPSMTFLNQNII